MSGHWYVVANLEEVKVFVPTEDGHDLQFVQAIVNPLGDAKNRDLIGKQAGTTMKTMGAGTVRHSQVKRTDPHDMVAVQFAREISEFLAKEQQKKSFEKLTIAAEPKFLGRIRAELESETEEAVVDWVLKDLQNTPDDRLPEFLLEPKKESPLPNDFSETFAR